MSRKSNRINLEKWEAGNLLYCPRRNKMCLVIDAHIDNGGTKGIAVLSTGKKLKLVKVLPEGSPDLDYEFALIGSLV